MASFDLWAPRQWPALRPPYAHVRQNGEPLIWENSQEHKFSETRHGQTSVRTSNLFTCNCPLLTPSSLYFPTLVPPQSTSITPSPSLVLSLNIPQYVWCNPKVLFSPACPAVPHAPEAVTPPLSL